MPQLQAMEENKLITWVIEATSEDTRGEISDALGLPKIDFMDFDDLTRTGMTGQIIKGLNLIVNQTWATARVGSAAVDPTAMVDIRPILPGGLGNLNTLSVVDTGVGGLTFAFVGDVLTIDLGGDVKTATQIEAALNADAVAAYFFAYLPAGSGAGNIAVQSDVAFDGGQGDGVSLTVAGAAAAITAIDEAATPQTITFDTPDVSTFVAAASSVNIELRSGAKISNISVIASV
jgi:hypothetical protein